MARWTTLRNSTTIIAAGVFGYITVTPSGGNAAINLASGLNQRIVLNGTAVNILAPTYSGPILAGTSFSLYLDQDSTGSRATPTFTGGTNGFVSSTHSQIQIDGTPSTRTSLVFTLHPTPNPIWSLDSITTGASLS